MALVTRFMAIWASRASSPSSRSGTSSATSTSTRTPFLCASGAIICAAASATERGEKGNRESSVLPASARENSSTSRSSASSVLLDELARVA